MRHLSVCLSVNKITHKSQTTDQIVMKFYGLVGHYPGTNRLDFGGNQDPDSDRGSF